MTTPATNPYVNIQQTIKALQAVLLVDPQAKIITSSAGVMSFTPTKTYAFGDEQQLIGGGWTKDPVLGWSHHKSA